MKPKKEGMLNLITKGILGHHISSLTYIPSTSQILNVCCTRDQKQPLGSIIPQIWTRIQRDTKLSTSFITPSLPPRKKKQRDFQVKKTKNTLKYSCSCLGRSRSFHKEVASCLQEAIWTKPELSPLLIPSPALLVALLRSEMATHTRY